MELRGAPSGPDVSDEATDQSIDRRNDGLVDIEAGETTIS
jgi:hypothetical protein